jgi:hypothetical protein
LVVPNPFRASTKAIRIQAWSFLDSEFMGIEDSAVAVARFAFRLRLVV